MTPAEVLAALRASYIAARERRSAAAVYTTSSCPAGVCRYCGKRTQSRTIDGHLRCIVDATFVYELRAAIRHRADIDFLMVAVEIGLTGNQVRRLFDRDIKGMQ